MGALDDGCFNLQLENEINIGCIEVGVALEPKLIAIENAVKVLLQGLGEDINREGLRKTPLRVAMAFREGTIGYRQKVKDIIQGAMFPEPGSDNVLGHAGGSGGLVIVRDLDLFSYCESCLLPFKIKCHVGYVPAGTRVLGLSKLFRVASIFAKRLQEPQRLANELASALQHGIKPAGVAVILHCSHFHFPEPLPPVRPSSHNGWITKTVSSGSGVFENNSMDSDPWADFLGLLRIKDLSFSNQDWCFIPGTRNTSYLNPEMEMLAASSTILLSLVGNPREEDLSKTPARFVDWLMKFRNFTSHAYMEKSMNSGRINKEIEFTCESNLPFWSLCEHHLLPFHGVAHIGYFSEGKNPKEDNVLLSIVHRHGFKLQTQERLTREIAEAVSSFYGDDVMVAVEAFHLCMISRGIEKFGSSTVTMAVLGRFSSDPSAKRVFLDSIPG